MAAHAAGNIFYTIEYNEQQLHFHRFSMADIQYPTGYLFDDLTKVFKFVDTDGV